MQGSGLPTGRVQAGVCDGSAGDGTGGVGQRHRGARTGQVFRAVGAEGGFRDPLELCPADRAGYYPGGCEAGGMPGAERKTGVSNIIEN